MIKQKQKHASKEDIIAIKEQQKEVKRQRDLVKDKVWPILLKGSTSIANAEQMVNILNTTIRQAFNARMKDLKLSELNLREKIDGKVPQADYYLELIDLLAEEKLTDVVRLTEGVGNEIGRLCKKEQNERKFETLITDFIELNEKKN